MPEPSCSSVPSVPVPVRPIRCTTQTPVCTRRGGRAGLSAGLSALLMALGLALATVSVPFGLVHARAAAPARAPIEGVSIDVTDGDTFVLRDDLGQRLRVRIAGIDAPESHQAFADRSRQHLRELLRDRRVRLEPLKQDVYGRLVARVWLPDQVGGTPVAVDAGLAQIEAGLAWHFKRYRSDQSPEEFERYAHAEREARSQGAGLWSSVEPEPPWAFRERTRERTGSRRP